MRKIFTILALALTLPVLGACNDTNSPIRIINQTSYPNQPDIVLPPAVDLEDLTFDIPRDLSQQIIKNTPACQSVAAANRTKAFWLKCGEYKAIENSNIYVGLSRADFEKLRRNLGKLRVRDQELTQRIEQVNQQRAIWRALNNQNEAQAEAVNTKSAPGM